MLWRLLDIAFIAFHSALLLFNLLGWAVRPLRRLNLITLLLTGFSWTVLGLFFGFGYCPLTDWHWQVLECLGEPSRHTSYIQYLLERTAGIAVSARLADGMTLALYLAALACSLAVNLGIGRKVP